MCDVAPFLSSVLAPSSSTMYLVTGAPLLAGSVHEKGTVVDVSTPHVGVAGTAGVCGSVVHVVADEYAEQPTELHARTRTS